MQLFVALLTTAGACGGGDPRALYDVSAYRLDLRVDPSSKSIAGWAFVEGKVGSERMGTLHLDLHQQMAVDEVRLVAAPIERALATSGEPVEFAHKGAVLACELAKPVAPGATFAVAVRYHGSPGPLNSFDGFHWSTTPSGKPWIGTSMQSTGSAYWFPCKDSFFHPEDKPERLCVEATVPAGLYAVSNGRLEARETVEGGWERFRWQHDYPLMTYTVTLNVAPYVVVESPLRLEGISEPVPFLYYVLEEDAEKAKVQFAQVPELLAVYGRAFGPYPFPRSKFALVETSFWGMEHSTAVAYGNSFPAWCAQHGVKDKYGRRNELFDYILVHEVAHEWWGNAVSAADWRDFWLHEGFGNYAEGVYVELTAGPELAAKYWRNLRGFVDKRGSLDRGAGSDSEQAYGQIIYSKGAWVLHTLRTFVADDDKWWKTLRDFNLEFRYRNATTVDFQRVLERETGEQWGRFFEEWFHGSGYPKVEGKVAVDDNGFSIEADSAGTNATTFHVPLDLTWSEGEREVSKRVWLDPGKTSTRVDTPVAPRDVRITNLERMLGSYEVRVLPTER